jgi:hypothetical protein
MAYRDLLLHPKWDKKRKEILARDNYTCTRCGRNMTDNFIVLHVHHRKYISGRMPWEYENSNFSTLCGTCHRIISEKINEFEARQFIHLGDQIKERLEREGKLRSL